MIAILLTWLGLFALAIAGFALGIYVVLMLVAFAIPLILVLRGQPRKFRPVLIGSLIGTTGVCIIVSFAFGGLYGGTAQGYGGDWGGFYDFLLRVLPIIALCIAIGHFVLWTLLQRFSFHRQPLGWMTWLVGVLFVLILSITPKHDGLPLNFIWRDAIRRQQEQQRLAAMPQIPVQVYKLPQGFELGVIEHEGTWYQGVFVDSKSGPNNTNIIYRPRSYCPIPTNHDWKPLDVALVPGGKDSFKFQVEGNRIQFPFVIQRVDVPKGSNWSAVAYCVKELTLESLPKQLRLYIPVGWYVEPQVFEFDVQTGGQSFTKIIGSEGGWLNLPGSLLSDEESSFNVPAGVMKKSSRITLIRIPRHFDGLPNSLEVATDTYRVISDVPIPSRAYLSIKMAVNRLPEETIVRTYGVVLNQNSTPRIEVLEDSLSFAPNIRFTFKGELAGGQRELTVYGAVRKYDRSKVHDPRVFCDFSPANYQSAYCTCMQRKGWPRDSRGSLTCSKEAGEITELEYQQLIRNLPLR